MSREYHYLVAGFPDIFIEDSKISIRLDEFRQLLSENLPAADMDIIRLFFYRYDNDNVLAKLVNPESAHDPRGNLAETDIENLFLAVREGSPPESSFDIPEYFSTFIEAYKTETPLEDGKSWENQLAGLYYSFSTAHRHNFIREWFGFERDFQNLLTALLCRKYNLPVENQLTGPGELNEKLAKSNARDFGLDNDFPFLEQIFKAAEETDLKEYEKKIDRIRWDYLDENVFFHYFTIEKLFSFLIKLSIVERWISLDKETGETFFRELLSNMEAAYEFPEEFK